LSETAEGLAGQPPGASPVVVFQAALVIVFGVIACTSGWPLASPCGYGTTFAAAGAAAAVTLAPAGAECARNAAANVAAATAAPA
jgi:hypothetical protein